MEGDPPCRAGTQCADDEGPLAQRAGHTQNLLQDATVVHFIEKNDWWVQSTARERKCVQDKGPTRSRDNLMTSSKPPTVERSWLGHSSCSATQPGYT